MYLVHTSGYILSTLWRCGIDLHACRYRICSLLFSTSFISYFFTEVMMFERSARLYSFLLLSVWSCSVLAQNGAILTPRWSQDQLNWHADMCRTIQTNPNGLPNGQGKVTWDFLGLNSVLEQYLTRNPPSKYLTCIPQSSALTECLTDFRSILQLMTGRDDSIEMNWPSPPPLALAVSGRTTTASWPRIAAPTTRRLGLGSPSPCIISGA